MSEPPRAMPATQSRTSALVAVVGIACAGICAPFVTSWEDGSKPRLTTYRDIGGVVTACGGITGPTIKLHQVYTPEQCRVMVDARYALSAQQTLNRSPVLRGHPYQLAAATSLEHNIGVGSYGASTVAKRFDAHQWAAACDAFSMWVKVNGKPVQGLINRRKAERALCLTELPK